MFWTIEDVRDRTRWLTYTPSVGSKGDGIPDLITWEKESDTEGVDTQILSLN